MLSLVRFALALALAFALGGCRQLLGIDEPTVADASAASDVAPDSGDAPPCVDTDDDGLCDDADRCPHLADPSDPDQDGDGVGDLCDVHPETPTERRLLWTSFDAMPAGWVANGTWDVSGGFARGTGAPNASLHSPSIPGTVHLTTKLSIVQFGPAPTSASAGVISGIVADTQFYVCGVGRFGGQSELAAAARWSGQPDMLTSVPWSSGFVDVIVTQVDVEANECFARSQALSVTTQTMEGPRAGYAGLFANQSTAQFDYLFIVETSE